MTDRMHLNAICQLSQNEWVSHCKHQAWLFSYCSNVLEFEVASLKCEPFLEEGFAEDSHLVAEESPHLRIWSMELKQVAVIQIDSIEARL